MIVYFVIQILTVNDIFYILYSKCIQHMFSSLEIIIMISQCGCPHEQGPCCGLLCTQLIVSKWHIRIVYTNTLWSAL